MSDGANIEYYLGETITLRLACLDSENQPSDLTNYTVSGWVKQSPRDETEVLDLAPTISDPESGIVEVDCLIDGVIAGNYTWRVTLTNPESIDIVIANGNLKLRP